MATATINEKDLEECRIIADKCREEAKKRLINVLVGLAIIVALILFFQLCINVILPAFFPGQWQTPATPGA